MGRVRNSDQRWQRRDVLLAAAFCVLAALAILLGWNIADAPEGY